MHSSPPSAPENMSSTAASLSSHVIAESDRIAAFRMRTIYPGHPCLVAMQIMCAFPRYQDAAQTTEHGWSQALSCSQVRGAGGAVNQAMEILRLMSMETMSAAEAFEFGCMLWNRSRRNDHPDALADGNEAAERQRCSFVDMADLWTACDNHPQALQEGPGTTIPHPA